MQAIRSATRMLFIGVVSSPGFMATAGAQTGDSIRGRPSESKHFIETPRGRRHPLTAEAKRKAYAYGNDWALPGEHIDFKSKDDFDSWHRCITRGKPSMAMPYHYNGEFEFMQARGAAENLRSTNG